MKPFFENANEKTNKIYAAVSAVFSLLGVLGLIIGYFTGGSPIGHAIAGGEPILKGSLMGVVIEICRGSIQMPSYNLSRGLSGFLPMTLYILVLVLIGVVLLSLAATIAAILLPRFARAIMLFEGRLLFLLYLLLFAGNAHLYLLSGGTLTASPFDIPSFLTAMLLLIVLFSTAFAENKLKATLSAFLFGMSFLSASAFFLPSTPLLKSLNALPLHEDSTFVRVTLILFCIVAALEFLISTVRLHSKHAYILDIVRFGIEFCCLIALIGAYSSGGNFFSQPLTAVFLLLGSLGGTSLSVFLFVAFSRPHSPRRASLSDPIPAKS